jgi:hypothetical protein
MDSSRIEQLRQEAERRAAKGVRPLMAWKDEWADKFISLRDLSIGCEGYFDPREYHKALGVHARHLEFTSLRACQLFVESIIADASAPLFAAELAAANARNEERDRALIIFAWDCARGEECQAAAYGAAGNQIETNPMLDGMGATFRAAWSAREPSRKATAEAGKGAGE